MMNPRTQVSRRTVAKGAAWTLPVVAVAAGAPSASASVVCAKGSVTTGTVGYWGVVALDIGGGNYFTVGSQKVNLTVTFDGYCTTVTHGTAIGAPSITISVPFSGSSDATVPSGSGTLRYTVGGNVVGAGARSTALTVTPVTTPPAGGLVLTAKGTGQNETAGAAGTANVASGYLELFVTTVSTDNGTQKWRIRGYASATSSSDTSLTYPTTPAITVV